MIIVNITKLGLTVITVLSISYCLYTVHPMLAAGYIVQQTYELLFTVIDAMDKKNQQKQFQQHMNDMQKAFSDLHKGE